VRERGWAPAERSEQRWSGGGGNGRRWVKGWHRRLAGGGKALKGQRLRDALEEVEGQAAPQQNENRSFRILGFSFRSKGI